MRVKRTRMVVPLGGNEPTQPEEYEVEVPDEEVLPSDLPTTETESETESTEDSGETE